MLNSVFELSQSALQQNFTFLKEQFKQSGKSLDKWTRSCGYWYGAHEYAYC